VLTQHLLIELAVILVVVQVCGYACGLIGQPWVIGEVIAGIVLGPSVLGALFPGISAQLFPPSILPVLQALGDLGLVLYPFTVGVSLDVEHLLREGRRAARRSSRVVNRLACARRVFTSKPAPTWKCAVCA
jgi:Kef-type K+ transport system membrane component KefB